MKYLIIFARFSIVLQFLHHFDLKNNKYSSGWTFENFPRKSPPPQFLLGIMLGGEVTPHYKLFMCQGGLVRLIQ